ncbi:response regulator transcription factor [Streptomyces aquilus]|uniref:response regulator transcription factor n=1 Tax=Streptomyces aquilus TaxID=2548456 RepID=UPI001FCCB298|nr:response regulator transcription factor [Streptomyces aquilus]
MTATLTAPPASAVAVRVASAPGADRVRAVVERAGLGPGTDESVASGTVTVIVAADVDQALRRPRPPGPVLFVCDTVGPEGRRRALRAGAVVIGAAELAEDGLREAVLRAAHPHPSIPYPELSGVLSTGLRPDGPPAARAPALTARQTEVLRLMAEGHGNADIALLLGCSEHTVKNVIYELMTRLQARNRAHAVAHAVRHGLV